MPSPWGLMASCVPVRVRAACVLGRMIARPVLLGGLPQPRQLPAQNDLGRRTALFARRLLTDGTDYA